MNRRKFGELIAASSATALVPGLARPARAAEPLKVGLVYVGPVGDFGWTYQKSAPITVLFTDIQLPDGTGAALDGVELARRAVDLQPGLRVIYTSGGAQTDGITALFVEGAIFLQKPYTREQLIEALGSPGDQKTAPVA